MTVLTFDEARTAAGALHKYDADEARDDHGRWSGGGVAFASPSVTDKDLPRAVQDISGSRHKLFEKAAKEVDGALGISGQHAAVVGAWSDGAENSTMLETDHRVSPEALRLSAAMKGYIGQQKAVLVFTSDPAGAAAMYDLKVPTDVQATHAALLKAGVPFHTLVPVAGGTRVLVVDTDGSLGHQVGDYAAAHNTDTTRMNGHAEFIGDELGTGTDAEQRERGREAYERVIQASAASKYQGRAVGGIWSGLRDRWAAQLQAVKRALTFGAARAAIERI